MKNPLRAPIGVSALALTCAIAGCAKGDAAYLDWYGFKLDQVASNIPRSEVSVDNVVGQTVPNPPPPWTAISLVFDQTTKQLVRIEFHDDGVGFVVCGVAPCPPGDRIKPVSQLRAEADQVRRELETRLGPPTHADADETTWLFPAARDFCGPLAIAGNLAADPTGRLYSVSFRHSDDDMALNVTSAGLQPGSPPPSSPSPLCR